MDCPVCNSSSIAEESKNCPHCSADFEAFKLTKRIEKSGKNTSIFAWVAVILFFIVLIIFVVLFVMTPKTNQPTEQEMKEVTQLETELAEVAKQNESLLIKNNELKAQLNKPVEEKAKREKIYIVKAGESLFAIARKVLGNGFKYHDIAKDNNISDPDIITTGQKLVIYY